MKAFIHQLDAWPNFTWSLEEVIHLFSEVRHLQGHVLGRMASLGFDLRNEANLETLTIDVLKSTEIEGEFLDPEQVRSSIARRLGIEIAGSIPSDRDVEGIVELMLDATQHYQKPLTAERLFDWHAALFPTGRSGRYKITVGNWRSDSTGPMQVVSGAMGKEKLHFEAPDSSRLASEMTQFINWFNSDTELDEVLKAAVAHLWFVTIHPFDDGNGRITRALTDMLLAQSDKSAQRFYSMSAQISIERKKYYEILEKTQRGNLDITDWIKWFLNCLKNALLSTDTVLNRVLFKSDFWNRHAKTVMNERQKMILNKVLDKFEGKLTSSKWAKMAKCSKDTAIRDINDLIEKNILKKEDAGGRNTNYELV